MHQFWNRRLWFITRVGNSPHTVTRLPPPPNRRQWVAHVTRSKTLPKRLPHSIPLVKEIFLVWNLHKDFFPTNSPSRIVIKEGWLRESKSAEKLGRESFPFHAVNSLTPEDNAAKVSYLIKGLTGLSSSTAWQSPMACRTEGPWICMYSQLATREVLDGHIYVWSSPQVEEAYISPCKCTVTCKTHVLPSLGCHRWEI